MWGGGSLDLVLCVGGRLHLGSSRCCLVGAFRWGRSLRGLGPDADLCGWRERGGRGGGG